MPLSKPGFILQWGRQKPRDITALAKVTQRERGQITSFLTPSPMLFWQAWQHPRTNSALSAPFQLPGSCSYRLPSKTEGELTKGSIALSCMKRALSHARVSREGRERERESGSPGNLISLQGWDQAGKEGVDSSVMIWVTDSAAGTQSLPRAG